ncbi:MAG: hypothetical protein ABIJ45_13075 [Candidatus Zixiibacteriota bacterium]
MAKLMSKKTRETVTTSVVLAVIILFVIFYIIYPLVRVGDITSRPIPEDENGDAIEFVMNNDPAYFIENGFSPDTFSMITDDNIQLAALYFAPDSTRFDSISSTAILLHDIDGDRTSLKDYIQPLLDMGMAVVIYDQRACGFSGGEYHTPGIYESDDLNQLLAHLKIRDKIFDPVICIGFGLGGDAALNASRTENKIGAIIAIDPYLSSSRWMRLLKEKAGLFSIPFSNAVYFYWYQKISGYPIERGSADDIIPVEAKTIIYVSPEYITDDEILQIRDNSADFITIRELPVENDSLVNGIIESVRLFNNQITAK